MPNRFARCQNTDYCTLADRRLVLRLAEDESFFCPECAHPLAAAPPWGQRRAPWALLGAVGMAAAASATCLLVVQNWPGTMAYVPPSVSRALAYFVPAVPPPPNFATPADRLPTPQQFLVAATMDSWLPHQAGDHVLHPRHPRPPRSDPAAAAARAALEAGVPPLGTPEEADAPAIMPWRQALIMAALVTQAGHPPPAPPMPIAAPPPQPPAPPAYIPAPLPHASLINPPTETDAERKLELALADGFIRGIRHDDSGLTDHIVTPAPVPPPPAPAGAASDKPAPAVAKPPTAIAGATAAPTPRHPDTAANSQVAQSPAKTASVPTPKDAAKHAAKNTPHPTIKQLAWARIPKRRATIAANILAPIRRMFSQPAAPPPVAAVLPSTPPAAAPQPHSVVLAPSSNGGFTGLKYGALTDTNLQSIPAVASSERLTGGSMMVDCAVPANGVPTDCKLLQSDKSPAVAHAVLAMLTSGLVHKTPKSEHGALVRQRWPINFPAPTPHRAETLEPEDQPDPPP